MTLVITQGKKSVVKGDIKLKTDLLEGDGNGREAKMVPSSWKAGLEQTAQKG